MSFTGKNICIEAHISQSFYKSPQIGSLASAFHSKDLSY